jgi:hypothetical protein
MRRPVSIDRALWQFGLTAKTPDKRKELGTDSNPQAEPG